jgi:alkanesulfonate monooxygenase SsuD/methylene tetrahydromethanopterin reductase-like flavin-dependent oxidoreductase (luciferase family)
MRIGLMVGPERNRYATKVERMISDAVWAEEHGLSTVWIPQVPDEFDAMTAAALIAQVTSRVEIGTAVVPLQSRHPVALVQQSLSTQLVAQGRFTLGLGPSHHWIIEDMLGLPYERPAALTKDYLDVLDAAMDGPGPVDVENERFTIHNPMHVTDEPRMVSTSACSGWLPTDSRAA